MLDELTPEQAYELILYHGIEPFGEVRKDMRMAKMMQFYYDSKRGSKGKSILLGEFMMYEDIAEKASDPAGEAALLKALSGGG